MHENTHFEFFSYFGILLLIILPFLIVWVPRILLVKKLKRLMHANSKLQTESIVPVTIVEKAQQVNPIIFFEINSNIISDETAKKSELLIQRAKDNFWKSTFGDWVVGAAFIFFPFIFLHPGGAPNSRSELGEHAGIWIGIMMILLSGVRYFYWRFNFRAYRKGLFWKYLSFWYQGSKSLILSPKYRLNFTFIFLSTAVAITIYCIEEKVWATAVALLMVIVFYGYMIIFFLKFYRKVPN